MALVVQRVGQNVQQHATIMTAILTYTILFCLSFFPQFAGYRYTPETDVATNHCSSTYNFCVNYPASLLPVKELLPDDTGIRLKTRDLSSEVTVQAIPGHPGMTPKALFEATLEKISGEVTVISSAFGDDYYEAQFLDVTGGANYLHRVDYLPKHYIRLIARVPAGRPWLIERLKEDVTVQFDR